MVGKWQLDYSPVACRLLATFGPEKETVEFSQTDPRGKLRLSIVSRTLPSTSIIRYVSVWLDDPDHFLPLQSAPLPTIGGLRVLHIPEADGLREALAAGAAKGGLVTLSFSTGGHNRSYQLGKITSLLSALDRCMDDLVTSWGYDAAEQRAATPPIPVAAPASWVTDKDYPQFLSRDAKGGGLNARLDIDAAGSIVGCQAQEAGGAKEFYALTCRLLKERGRYTPAKAKDGRPIASYVFLKALWRVSAEVAPL